MIRRIANESINEGRLYSRLPSFSNRWIDIIRGSADFLALNYYTSYFVESMSKSENNGTLCQRDTNLKCFVKPEWKQAASEWLYSVPNGLGDLLR